MKRVANEVVAAISSALYPSRNYAVRRAKFHVPSLSSNDEHEAPNYPGTVMSDETIEERANATERRRAQGQSAIERESSRAKFHVPSLSSNDEHEAPNYPGTVMSDETIGATRNASERKRAQRTRNASERKRAQRQSAIERKIDVVAWMQKEQRNKAIQEAVAAERKKEKQREAEALKAEAAEQKAKAVALAKEKKAKGMRGLRLRLKSEVGFTQTPN